jgi:rod shape-determining protein MreD
VILTPPILVRLAVLIFLTVILQLSFFSQLPLLGSVPAVLPVVIVSLGLLGGAVIGAGSGFAAGLLIDLALGDTLGVSSLSLMAAGYLAGRWREGYEISSSIVPPLIAGILTGVAALVFGGLHLTLGVDAPISLLVIREVLVQAFLGMLLAIPIFPLVRRIVRPALVEEHRAARRRAAPGIMRSSSRTGFRSARFRSAR